MKHRQAISVAMDREAIRTAVGGDFVGDFATGAIKPNLGAGLRRYGLYTDLYGKPIPPDGDPEFAKELIAESGEPMPELTFELRGVRSRPAALRGAPVLACEGRDHRQPGPAPAG